MHGGQYELWVEQLHGGLQRRKGYDLATGIGSIDVAKFVNDWGTVKFATTTTTLAAGTSASSLSTSPLTVAHAQLFTSRSASARPLPPQCRPHERQTHRRTVRIITRRSRTVWPRSQLKPYPADYTLYARYGGDTGNASSQSQGIQVTVLPENKLHAVQPQRLLTPKTGDLTAILAKPARSMDRSFYANISPLWRHGGPCQGNPATGTLTLSQNGAQLTTITLDSQGVAKLRVHIVHALPRNVHHYGCILRRFKLQSFHHHPNHHHLEGGFCRVELHPDKWYGLGGDGTSARPSPLN